MASYPKLWTWILRSLLGPPVTGFTIFYCVLHLGFGIPVARLVEPFVVTSVISIVLTGPLLYWARKREVVFGDLRAHFFGLGLYSLILCLAYVCYSVRLGFLSAREATEYYTFLPIFVAVVTLLGFYVHRRVFRGQ